jgi:PAS domain S-box-containing protein
MEFRVPTWDRPFTVQGTEVRPEDPPALYLRKLARIALDEMPQLVGVLSTDGILLDCNRAALARCGVTRQDVSGRPLWETAWCSTTPRAQAHLRDAISRAARGEFVRYDVEVFDATGGADVMVLTLLPVKDEQGRIVFLLAEGREPEIARKDLSSTAMTSLLAEEVLQRPSEPALTQQPETATGNPRVLWADDDADLRAYVTRILSQHYDVQAVGDGDAALEAIRTRPPDLVLIDVMSPKLDGFGVLRALRADPNLREVPVILLSARVGEDSRVEGIEAGADDYLLKPFSARELIARVEINVRVSRMRQEAKRMIRAADERVKTFANTAPAILWTTESDGACSFVSRGWYEYTGQLEGSAIGLGWLDAVHPDDREEAQRVVRESNRERREFSLDCRVRRADGAYRWVVSSGRPRFHSDGRFAGFAGSVIDIHERKQAGQYSALLSAIVDSSDDAIISKNLDGIIMSWNRGAERLFGYTAEEAIGKSITLLIPRDRLDEEPRILERLRRGERVEHFETIRVRKDGSQLNISLTISPVRDADGRIVGASKIARDITDRVRQAQALKTANAALRQANADLQQFAYSASHDLQEPLRMVATYSELLKKRFAGQLGPVADEYIGYTFAGAIRMENLLRDMRTYTQLSTADQAPVGEVDAGNVLNRALSNLEVAIRDSGASLEIALLPAIVMHEFQLEQVFQNLIGNAIRYRSEEPPRISISAREDGDFWLFAVQDNGMGIDPQYKDHVFGLFKRLHSAAEFPGTGMGLAICQRIVERVGGRIWVESEVGKGSTFYFTVPRVGQADQAGSGQTPTVVAGLPAA